MIGTNSRPLRPVSHFAQQLLCKQISKQGHLCGNSLKLAYHVQTLPFQAGIIALTYQRLFRAFAIIVPSASQALQLLHAIRAAVTSNGKSGRVNCKRVPLAPDCPLLGLQF